MLYTPHFSKIGAVPSDTVQYHTQGTPFFGRGVLLLHRGYCQYILLSTGQAIPGERNYPYVIRWFIPSLFLPPVLSLCIYIYIYIYTHTYTHTHTHIYIYIYIYTHTHTHIYILYNPRGRSIQFECLMSTAFDI